MADTKRHPEHPGGVWPLNVEYRNEPRITVMAGQHPADTQDVQATAETRAKAVRAREVAADEAYADANGDAPAKQPQKK